MAAREGPHVTHLHVAEAINTGVSIVATTGPFRIQMIDDGIGSVQPDEEKRSIRAFDIAELLEVSVELAAIVI